MSDIFFRADNFKEEPWYEEFQIFLHIGVCKPVPEHLEAVKAAIYQMGYETVTELPRNGEIYLSGTAGRNGK